MSKKINKIKSSVSKKRLFAQCWTVQTAFKKQIPQFFSSMNADSQEIGEPYFAFNEADFYEF